MEQEFTFKLTRNEANAILSALQELPAKLANPITKKMQDQALEQLSKEAENAGSN